MGHGGGGVLREREKGYLVALVNSFLYMLLCISLDQFNDPHHPHNHHHYHNHDYDDDDAKSKGGGRLG